MVGLSAIFVNVVLFILADSREGKLDLETFFFSSLCAQFLQFTSPAFTKIMEADLDLSDHKVTSEVHVFSEGESQGDDESIGKIFSRLLEGRKFTNVFVNFTVISKFNFTLPNKLVEVGDTCNVNQDASSVDDDGDLVVRRKDYSPDYSLSISIYSYSISKISCCQDYNFM